MPQGPRASARRHDWIDDRSLAFGLAIAEKVRANPQLVVQAGQRLDEWEATAVARGDTGVRPVFVEWREVLHALSLEELLAFLGTDTSERATRMRQSTPFVGVLSEPERAAILARFETL